MSEQLRIEGPDREEIGEDLAESWEQMVEDAEQEIQEVRVSMRWLGPQVTVIKRAAARFGIPYQTYIKHVVFRQALADLKASEVVGESLR